MSREAFYRLLQRYQEGKCSEHERRIVEQWYGLLDDDTLPPVSEDELEAMDQRLWTAVSARMQQPVATDKPHRKLWPVLSIAASVAALVCCILGYFIEVPASKPLFAASVEVAVVHQINDAADTLRVTLADGTHIILQPGAAVTYPSTFAENRREVTLRGEAFFEVAKNKDKPFFVYSDNLITEVVGTSFTIRTDDKTSQSEVSVVSGRVIVVRNEDSRLLQRMVPGSGRVALTPNQRVEYNPGTSELRVSLVSSPQPVTKEAAPVAVDFNADEITTVLSRLAQLYHVPIEPDNATLDHCTFTGDLTGLDLYTSLDLVCKSVGAAYTVNGTTVTITGGNCRP